MLSLELFTLTFCVLSNIISCKVLFFLKKSYIEHVKILNYEEKNTSRFLLQKITDLENEVSEIHETIDSLEEKFYVKDINLRQSNEYISNKLDNFITRNYDKI